MRMVVRYGGVGWVVFCVVVHRTAVPNMWNTFRCLLQTRINNRIIDKYVNCRDAPSGTTKSAYAQAERIYAKRVRDPFVQKCILERESRPHDGEFVPTGTSDTQTKIYSDHFILNTGAGILRIGIG